MSNIHKELIEIEKRLQWICEYHNMSQGYVSEANALMDRRHALWTILYYK